MYSRLSFARNARAVLLAFLFSLALTARLQASASPQTKPSQADPSSRSVNPAPTDADIFISQAFEEPLVPIGGKTAAKENAALGKAILSFTKRTDQDDNSAITQFLDRFPKSAWRPALLLNLGLQYRQTGWFLKALVVWDEAWTLSKTEKSASGKALADRAVAELAELNARLGRREKVEAILKEIEKRPLTGPATEKIVGAREGVWMMRHEPGKAFKCGPLALDRIRAFQNPALAFDPKIIEASSIADRGFSLDRVCDLSKSLDMNYQMARRSPGSEIVVPSVVHWKAGHYAALVREDHDKFLIQDPTFGTDIWVTKAVLDAEGSGYCLIRQGELPKGWQTVTLAEAKNVWGMGNVHMHDTSGTKTIDDKAKPECATQAMAAYNFHTQLVSLNIVDTPAGYTPPSGPDMHFVVTYNQREANQPAIFSFPNFGAKWMCNWVAYVEDTEFPNTVVTVNLPGGGTEQYTPNSGDTSNSTFQAPGFQSGAILTRDYNPGRYTRTLPDGSKQLFFLNTGGVNRRSYMTQIADPAGQAACLNYDPTTYRLTSVTDALGHQIDISYVGNPPSVTATDPSYYLIASINDHFHPLATFEYQNGELWKIHDPIGITSEFHYNDPMNSDFITSMITPYDTVTFSQPASVLDTDSSHPGNARVIKAVSNSDNGVERLEYGHDDLGHYSSQIPYQTTDEPVVPGIDICNCYHNYRNSFYWDKKTTAMYPPTQNPSCGCDVYDFTKAKLTQWLHTADESSASNIKEREKQPLENAVYYFYLGQNHVAYNATLNVGYTGFPNVIARVLNTSDPSNTTQIWRFDDRTPAGKPRKVTDPKNRVTTYTYAGNGIDLLNIYQEQPAGLSTDDYGVSADKLATYYYDPSDPPHLPRTYTDAAGETTTYHYNSNGQPTSVQNARGDTTTYDYTPAPPGVPAGYLNTITSPTVNSTSAKTSFTYLANAVRTVTNVADTYAVTIDRDALDRPTTITYPDTTNEQFSYTKFLNGVDTGIKWLDLGRSKDRLNHYAYREYDSNRHLTKLQEHVTDGPPSADRITQFGWCNCGALTSIVDGNNHTTIFNRDLQSRLTSKVFADNSSISYVYEPTTSRLQSMTDAISNVTSYTYNIDDTLAQRTNGGAATVSFGYEPNYNRVSSMTDGIGTTNYTYIPVTLGVNQGAGQLYKAEGFFPSAQTSYYNIVYSYDALGRATNQSINGVASSVQYDSLGRIDYTQNPLGYFKRAYFDPTSRIQTLNYRTTINGPVFQTANYIYFDKTHDMRLQTLQNRDGNSANISKFDYGYDSAEGDITSWTKQLSNSSPYAASFGYDFIHQLTTASNSVNGSYGYDLGANRTSDELGTHTFNSVNETQDTGYFYDGNGSLNNDPSYYYLWNGLNQLAVVEQVIPGTGNNYSMVRPSPTPTPKPSPTPKKSAAGSASNGASTQVIHHPTPPPVMVTYTHSEFTYDGLGRRVRIIEKQDTRQQGNTSPPNFVQVSDHRYIWSGNTIAEERDSAGLVVTKRFFAEGEQTGGTSYYFTRDHLGSVREVTNSSGQVLESHDYDPYGNQGLGNNLHRPTYISDFGFTGHYYHAPTALLLSLNRVYTSALGRWISRDPIGEAGGINLYGYAGNNPTNDIDPLGLSWLDSISHFDLYGSLNNAAANAYGYGGLLGNTGGIAANLGTTALDLLGGGQVLDAASRSGAAAGCGDTKGAWLNGAEATVLIGIAAIPGAAEEEAIARGATTADEVALRDLVNEATLGGQKALNPADTQTVIEWANEINYPGFRASPNDLSGTHWIGPHINMPGAGRGGHVPIMPGG